MKVILLQDIAKLGKKYESRQVPDGYALNFLIPQGKVEVATQASLRKIEKMKAEMQLRKKVADSLLAKELKSIEGLSITLVRRANEKGHLFAAIHESEISSEIEKVGHLSIATDHVVLEKPIKEVGTHTVTVAVSGAKATVMVIVEPTKE